MNAPPSSTSTASAAYDAFISYRSTAKAQARRVKAALEGLADPKNGDEPFRVFLDEASLLVGDLDERIQAGLKASRTLVVLMARDTVESKWVNREIEVWLEHGGSPKHLSLVRVDDVDLSWDKEARSWAHPEAVPPALHGVFKGEQKYISIAKNNRGADRTAVAAVFAAARDRPIESLLLEEAARARHRQRVIGSVAVAIAVLLVLAVAAGVWALVNRNRAEAATHDAVTSLIASQARVASTSDLEQALVLADTAFQSTGGTNHAQTLYDIASATPELISFFALDSPAARIDATPDGSIVVAATSTGEVVQFATATRTQTSLGHLEGRVDFLGISDDGRTVVASAYAEEPDATPAPTSWTRWQDGHREDPKPGEAIALSPSGRSLAVIHDDDPSGIEVIQGERVLRYVIDSMRPSWLVLPDDTSITAVNEYGEFLRASHDGMVQRGRFGMGTYMFGGSLAQDGRRFTYTNGGESIRVWDLSEAWDPEIELEPRFVGVTRSAAVSALSLSPDGSRLVTAADGRLFVSAVVPVAADSPDVEVLAGAGPSPHDLQVVGQDIAVSAAGTSVALWDLSREHVFARSWDIKLEDERHTIPRVSINNQRTRAVVEGDDGFLLADLGSDDRRLGPPGSHLPPLDASVWLDDHRLLTVDVAAGQATVLRDDAPESEWASFSIPADCGYTTPTSSSAVRDDGLVVLLNAGARLLIDPDQRTATCDETDAVSVTSNGELLIEILYAEAPTEPTTVNVFAADTMRKLGSVAMEATPQTAVDVTPDGRLVMVTHDPTRRVVEAVTIDTSRWTVTASRVLRTDPQWGAYGEKVDRGRMVMLEGTTVALYDLASGTRTPLLEIGNLATSNPGFGFSPDGRTLAVAANAEERLYLVPLDPNEWSAVACGRVWNASPSPDLTHLLEDSRGLVQGCQS